MWWGGKQYVWRLSFFYMKYYINEPDKCYRITRRIITNRVGWNMLTLPECYSILLWKRWNVKLLRVNGCFILRSSIFCCMYLLYYQEEIGVYKCRKRWEPFWTFLKICVAINGTVLLGKKTWKCSSIYVFVCIIF